MMSKTETKEVSLESVLRNAFYSQKRKSPTSSVFSIDGVESCKPPAQRCGLKVAAINGEDECINPLARF
jgi:hypothetical protein